jgi:hypothetical protein
MAEQKNEGEGNRTAARAYDRDQKRFAESGKVPEAARQAEQSLEDTEQRRHLEQAEREGKSHAHGEDPALKR